MVEINGVRFELYDLKAYHYASIGLYGQKEREGHFLAIYLDSAPSIIRIPFETKDEVENQMIVLDAWKGKIKKLTLPSLISRFWLFFGRIFL